MSNGSPDDVFFDKVDLLALLLAEEGGEAFSPDSARIAPVPREAAPDPEPEQARTGSQMSTPVDPIEGGAAPLDAEDEEVFVFPPSFAQQRLWFVDRMEPGNPFYNVPSALRLKGPLDADALARSLGEIVLRHEALRTVFAVEDEEPVQVVLSWRPFDLPREDLSGLPPGERAAELERRVVEDARRPFDLATGPLFRAALLRLSEEEHVLLLAMHHVVSDGWSMGILLRELTVAYAAFAAGEEPRLPDLPLQYADFAVWQREYLSGERLEAQLAYWRGELAGAPVLELPTDHPRPAVPTYRGGSVRFTVPAGVAAALRELAREEEATLFMPLLAAFQALLSRYAGQDDVVVGTAIANRNRSEIEGLIGFFVNTLALRADLSGDPSFRGLLRQVRERTFGAYAHQDLPFEKIVEELAPDRDLSRSPVFQVMFALQNAPTADVEETALRLSFLDGKRQAAKYDLTLTLAEVGDELHGGVAYAEDLFEESTARRITEHLRTLLESVAADPDVPVSALAILGADERRRVLEEWNATDAAYPAGLCVHELFEAQARRTPAAVAVVAPGERLSYAELDARADRLARALRGLGVGPDARVGLFLERGAEVVVAVLGILKAGAAYVALDPGYPDERLLFMLEDAGAAVLVMHATLEGRLGAFGGARVDVDTPHPRPLPHKGGGEHDYDTTEGEDRSVEMPLPRNGGGWRARGEPGGGLQASPDNLCYVIYTSGSTGTPKGVLVTHRGVVNYLSWFDREVLGEEGFDLPLVSRLSFDAHVRQLFPPLLRGGAVWVLPEETVTDPAALLAELAGRERVSFGGVPSLWSAMLERVRSGEAPGPEGLRAVLLGGEALSPELVERTLATFPGVAVWNHYGPTEATVNTTVARLGAGDAVHVGRPVANVRVYLLDARLQPVPVGVPGELYVGGAGVSRGYLGRPELTAERFVPDPFCAEAGARMYRSGDRVRWREEGTLEYLGRTDQQVKVRGFRIEPGEIEGALRAHPGVRDAVVVAREDEPGERRLVAYVTGREGAEAPTSEELRAHLRERLPDYMVPAAFVALERIPLTPNGKTDRRGLPAPEAGSEEAGEEPPRTPAEEILAGIYAEVLKLDRVGARQGFFELGGHSLLATRVVSRVRAAFGIELPLRAVFEVPTVAGLAERVDALLRASLGVQAPPLVPVPRDRPLPASFAQQRLWFIQQMEPESPAYNMPYALRLRGALDPRALERAFAGLQRRHESLRTTLALREGALVQEVAPAGPFPLPVDDLRALPDAAREAETLRRAQAEAMAPFDLERGPLLRASLLRLGEEEWALLVAVHHVVSDGWSTGILFGELSALYTAHSGGEAAALPPLPVQYADYAAWQRAWLTGETLERQMAWWRERLAGAPPLLEIPVDRPRPPVQSPRGGHRGFALPPAVSRAVRELARREGATLFMALLAAWQALLARYSGQDDVSVGTPIAGRTRLETEGLIGFFVNTLVLRADLSADPGFRALLAQVRETTLGAYAHQDLPFEKLVEEMSPERSLAHAPLFQAMFVLQNNERTAVRFGALDAEPIRREGEVTHFDLSLAVAEEGDELGGALSYRAELFDAATVDRMLVHLGVLLEGVAADPLRPVAHVPLLPPAERRQVVAEWNATERAYPRDPSVHRLFEEQAARTPDAVAVVFEGEALTYGELERRANRLAHHLRGVGAGPEVRVGVCLERSAEMVVALLAVLKSGGAYVPLDPQLPAERLAYMLADSAVRVLVTESGPAERLPEHGAAVVRLDGDAERIAAHPAGPTGVAADPDSLAYVIYTSGSTGRPKGAMNAHRGVVNRLLWMQERYGLGADDAVLQKTPFSFDVSVWEFFWPLLAGARLVVARPGGHREPAYLRSVVAGERITTLHFVPSMLHAFLEGGGAERGSLRRVVCSGEALSYPLQQRFFAALPGVELHNLYGPTEAAVDVTSWACVPDDLRGTVPIGRPVANTRTYVLDGALEPAPVGVPGELYLGGVQVGRGYLGRPDLTAERFVPDPFGDPGARLYRTGDLARWRRDAELEYLGRTDHQVKIRGFRVEPGEVESVLREHPAVRDAAVVAREASLAAYLVPAPGAEIPSAPGLRGWMRERLPEHMVPAAVVVLDALPLTASGKLDRRALPAPKLAADEEAYVAPSTPTEQGLAEIWGAVLGVERVGVRDGFFELGGHSLLATQVASRVREVFRVELRVADLFQYVTVEELARRVDDLVGSGARVAGGRIQRASRETRRLVK